MFECGGESSKAAWEQCEQAYAKIELFGLRGIFIRYAVILLMLVMLIMLIMLMG